MTREELIKAIYKDLGLCPDPHCDFLEEDCLECAEKQLAEYEARIRAGVIEEFLSKAKERKYHSEITCENAVAIAQLEWLAKELKEQKEGEKNDH